MEQNWGTREVSTEELDKEVALLTLAENEMLIAKETYKKYHEEYERQRAKILEIMQAIGKTSYKVDGVGTVSQVIKYQVKTPKEYEEKKDMISYFLNLGDEAYNFLSVNHMTLNSYVNEMCQNDPTFAIPGVGERQEMAELRLRKERSK